jgi:serine/threonine protein kinase
VDACEILPQNPHPNIAIYYGYEESHGQVAGICYKQYTSTLLEAVNPGRLDKRCFASSGRELVTDKTISSLAGVLDGIQHLHSLDIVHNDINPANIMFDKDGTLVLIDFDSCRYIGETLSSTKTKRTHQRHDPSVDVSLEKNDRDAFQELRIWLIGSADESYNFV